MTTSSRPLEAADVAGTARREAGERLPLIVRDVEGLAALARASWPPWRLPRGQFTLAIPGLSEDARLAAEEKLNKLARACGCEAGGIAGMLALASVIALGFFQARAAAWGGLALVLLAGIVLVPLAGGVGKLLGIGFARLRFRRTCARLIAELAAAPRPGAGLDPAPGPMLRPGLDLAPEPEGGRP